MVPMVSYMNGVTGVPVPSVDTSYYFITLCQCLNLEDSNPDEFAFMERGWYLVQSSVSFKISPKIGLVEN